MMVAILNMGTARKTRMGKYACQHGTAAAARFFSRTLCAKVSETTIVSIKKAYIVEKRKQGDEGDVSVLPHKRRGRPLLLGNLDDQVQLEES